MSAPPLTILNVRNVAAYGGSDTIMLQWCGALDRSCTPLVAVFANGDDAGRQTLDTARQIGLQTFEIPGGRRKALWKSVSAVVRLIRQHNVDVLHLHDVKSDLVGLVAARLTGRPAIGSAYAWFGRTSVAKVRLYEWLDARLLRKCDCVLANSEEIRRQSIALGVPGDRVRTIYGGIDFRSFQVTVDRDTMRRSLGAEACDWLIGNIARLYPEKNQATLLAAMPAVLAAVPSARLVVVGDGILKGDLRQIAERLGIADRVIFAGFRTDLPQVLKALDVQVHASLKEGLPVAVCAGMAAGLPVIATDIDGVSEVIRHGQTGVLIPPGDAEHLSAAIIALARDPAAARSLGERARGLMRDEFSLEPVVSKLEAIYRDVVHRHGTRGKVRGEVS